MTTKIPAAESDAFFSSGTSIPKKLNKTSRGRLLEPSNGQIKSNTSFISPSFEQGSKRKEFKAEKMDGQEILVVFKDDNKNVIATEVASRVNTVDLLITQCESKKAFLQGKLNKNRSGGRTKKLINFFENKPSEANTDSQIEKIDQKIKHYKDTKAHYNATWASTNAPRFAFRSLGKEAKQGYLPVLGNLRMHKVLDKDGKQLSAITRSAAITDFSHGEISLRELQDYENLIELSHGYLEPSKARSLIQFYNLADHANSLKHKELSKLLKRVKENVIQGYGNEILDKGGEISREKLREMINSRSEHLIVQVLQDLHTHFKTNPVKNSDTIYGRTSLLDLTKSPSFDSGFVLNERTQCLDMKAIYDQLDQSAIIFDIEDKNNKSVGPFIDERGVIHMPKSCQEGGIKSTKITTLFFNISVQGNTENQGIQKIINDEALEKLEAVANKSKLDKEAKEQLLKIKTDYLNGNEDPFEIALKITLLNARLGYASASCYGGKDRTAYLLALISREDLLTCIKDRPAREIKKLTKRLNRELLSKDSVAIQIIKNNTGHSVLKLINFDLKLYNTRTDSGMVNPSGVAKRIEDYGRTAWLFALNNQRGISDSPGQLYYKR